MIVNSATIIRGSYFNVHTSGYVRLLEKGGSILGRSIELPKNAKVCITDIDFYTNRVIATWQGKSISIDYEFILRNCSQEGPTLTQTVYAIQAVEIEPDEPEPAITFWNTSLFISLLVSTVMVAIAIITMLIIVK